ncbi:hypothetical protein [Rhodococcus opacus]|uniref:hypothetical protein n=1 Tax=Rhodococcus opacus TaxID=37919 RepID=UPI001F57D324|nr:hypothetical protein [Rhodococcus opacus]UNN05326.1 hypothetical protein MOO23_40660 [Rhodococcus opacus]
MPGRHRSKAVLPAAEYRRPPSLDSTGLVVTLCSENGTAEGVFDFTSLPGTLQLRQQFAAAFDRQIGPAGPWRAWDTCYCGYQSARLLLSGLAALEQPPATMAQITPAAWLSWRMSLPPTSGTRHHLVALRSLLAQARELPPETLEIVDRRVDPAPASTEIAYTYQEFLRIRSAAATVFNSALVRIRDNREHLRRWRAGEFQAASSGWLLGEALDCVARTGDVPLHAQAWRRPSRRHLTVLGGRAPQQTWGRLFLSRREVFAAAVLLVATESWNKSVLHRMRIPEHDPAVADAVEVFTVHLDKPRRPVRLRHTSANLVDNGPGSPGRLLRNVIEATEPARETLAVLGRPTDQLLVYRTACPSRRGQEFAFGIAKNLEVGTESVSLRRLRRTVQVLIRKEPAQNTQEVHDTVYTLRDPAGRAPAGETIAQGLTDAAEHAHLIGAMRLVLGSDAETLVELSDDPELAAAIQRGDLDTATAACTDYTHSPHNAPGLPCTASFLLCLACPNAVATRRHLPRLVHLHDGMSELHAVLDTTVWDQQWQQHFERVSVLLDAHTTAAERSDARARVTNADRTTIDRLLRRTFDA